jgi:hypothetical protein
MGTKLSHAAVGGLVVALAALLLPPPREAKGQRVEKPQQWEYQAVAFTLVATEEAHTKKLNALAAEGWEYAGPVVPPVPTQGRSVIAFKRPKQ